MSWSSTTVVQDQAVAQAPADSVQCLSWHSEANYLAAGSWDNSVRCWEVNAQGQSQAKAEQKMEGPVLDVAWHREGKLFMAGCDKKAQMWDLASNQMQQVAMHDAPIKTIHYIPELSCIMTGSWDKTLKFWDLRTPKPVANFDMPERVYAADVCKNMAVVATAQRRVLIFDLQGGPKLVQQEQTVLKMQTRCIQCFPALDGYAVGSIEGRVGIQYNGPGHDKTFSFKCHRDQTNIYCVNAVSFHPRYGTFSTAGADGTFVFWDKENRSRLKQFPKQRQPITATGFNKDGTLFAYAVSYDWSKGHEHFDPSHGNEIKIHVVQDAEVRPKPSSQQGRKR